MSLRGAGIVRRDIYTDSLLLETGTDIYALAMDQLKRLSSRRAGHVAMKRRYEGSSPGRYMDITCAPRLQRSGSGFGAVLVVEGNVFVMSIKDLVKVARGVEDRAEIWQDVPATSQQSPLGVSS